MATIRKKKDNKYEITVSLGYDINGKRIRKYLTYTPTAKTPKQIEKEVKKQAVLFEEKCLSGQVLNGNMKFKDFADIWFKDRKKDLRPKTYERYLTLLPRINQAIGHLSLSKIQPPHLRKFYKNLAEGGIRLDTKYKLNISLDDYLKENNLTTAEFCRRSNLPNTTVISIRKGNNVSKENAEKVCNALDMALENIFTAVDISKPLADETIRHHHRLISSILSTAVEWGYIYSNPCERTKPPKVAHKDPIYLDEKQCQILLELLEHETPTYKTLIHLLLMEGMRRGECLGLKWCDVDFDNHTMKICRTIQYTKENGVYEDETKNNSSNRVIALSHSIMQELKDYRRYQTEQRLKVGDRWKDKGYIFTNDFGEPLNPNTVSSWFSKFMKKHTDQLPYITLHKLRHTNATLQIALGTPITTVADRLGHSTSSTTADIYAHAIQSANRKASEKLDSLLYGNNKKNIG